MRPIHNGPGCIMMGYVLWGCKGVWLLSIGVDDLLKAILTQ